MANYTDYAAAGLDREQIMEMLKNEREWERNTKRKAEIRIVLDTLVNKTPIEEILHGRVRMSDLAKIAKEYTEELDKL